ncbi:SDR family oxidoreductase [Haliea sp. E1-2-M8]|uniref:SDR family oxidoreductase n=1 Tax=Haliea sp. E1-2-M8 TaxID=3064706 RepID=UPI0027216854|nr:SDR family oxidoreductase [Haliea sp. E1-2-M8]MDO8863660.1 SDR family oxidoreductase [Haliea sp. E1-2-M8]
MSSDQPVAFISAGAAGIGLAIARRLGNEGFACFVNDVDADAVAAFNREFGAGTAQVCDVSDPEQVDACLDTFIASSGRIDLLVNNVGIAGPTAAVEDIRVEDWQQTIDVDLSAHFLATRRLVPLMKEAGAGCIVNMSSNAGLHGFPLRSPYVAAKWALIGLTKTWAMELGRWKIRVNAVCPGSVSGPRIDRVIDRDASQRRLTPDHIRQVYQRQSSLRSFVDAEDIAAMVHFLASDAGARISGQAIAVDGNTEGLTNWLDE